MPAGVEGFEPRRLTMAREARAMRQRELAAGVERTEATVSKWENGIQRPEPNAIPVLADVLQVEVGWFFKPVANNTSAIFYRSLVSELQLSRARANARLSFVEAIEQIVTEYVLLPSVDLPDMLEDIRFQDLRNQDLEALAQEARIYWSLDDGPIEHLLLLMENIGIVIGEDNIDSVKLDGVSRWSNASSRPYVLLAKDKKAGVRRRFDAAHELAHILIHRNVSPQELVDNFNLIEEQAMIFAGALLMPADAFRDAVYSISLDGLLSLKESWGVSVGAMIKRLANLGEISPSVERRLWQYYSARKWRTREPLDDQIAIERPENLSSSIKMITSDGSLTKNGLLHDIGLKASDVSQLCALNPEFFDEPQISIKRKEVEFKNISQDDMTSPTTNVVPFRNRDRS